MVSFNFVVINGLAITTLASALPASQFPVIPKQMISREVRHQSKKRDHDVSYAFSSIIASTNADLLLLS